MSATRSDGVGHMRSQAAYCAGDTPIVLVSSDPKVQEVLRTLKVDRTYPDTTDADGAWNSSFKVEVSAR